MAIDLCSESSSTTMSPRISFSYDLSQTDVIPIEQRIFCSNSSSKNNIDFDFCVMESFEVESSSADELFFDGKILPIQIQKKIVRKKPPPQFESPPPPPLLPPAAAAVVKEEVESSKNERPKETKMTSSESDEKHSNSNSKSFWRFSRSSSLNCGSGYARTLCPIPLLSRSNSTGSASNVKRSSSSLSKDNHIQNQKQYSQKNQQSSSSSSYNNHKPPLKKNYGSYSNGVRVNPVLNVPSANLFGLGTIFSNGKDKNKKK